MLSLLWVGTLVAYAQSRTFASQEFESGITYTNERVATVPWSIHVIRIDRSNPQFEIRSAHAGGTALGLTTLSDQIKRLEETTQAVPIAAINGDFYQRERTYAGDPRGLQVVDGEVLSAPSGGVCFWIDAFGQPHATNVASLFRITWPNGATSSFGLNEERHPDGVTLYTPSIGSSTHTTGGREFILESPTDGPWLPLRMGKTYSARVRDIRASGDTGLASGILVLSLMTAAQANLSTIKPGAVLTLSTASSPDLRGVRTAIGGGPVLIRGGKRQKLVVPESESYEYTSMMERHPRSAIGWNQNNFFLVEVDGRQRNLSAGMTLDELAAYLARLGCTEAMSLDGGGSATLWYRGKVQNSPCDGHERAIANSLIVVKKNPEPRPPGAVGSRPTN